MSFRVGQKVVCIAPFDSTWAGWATPQQSKTYTVRAVSMGSVAQVRDYGPWFSVLLDEIKNPERDGEPTFGHQHFRPLIERKTDISIFTELLTPKQKQAERV